MQKKLTILLTNDDGIGAKGLNTLISTLSDFANLVVVAPTSNRSGASNALTLTNPLRVRHIEGLANEVSTSTVTTFALEGTPVDCVHFALNELLANDLPDFVISGINHGTNLADDAIYSGTVAAAMEGAFFGIPSFAISLQGHTHFDSAASVVRDLICKYKDSPMGFVPLLNINVPDCENEHLAGIKVTRLGQRNHAQNMIKEKDPRGELCYWVGPVGTPQDDGEGTDFDAFGQNYVTVTPLTIDLTAHERLSSVTQWLVGS